MEAVKELVASPSFEQALEAVWSQVCKGGGKPRFGEGAYFNKMTKRRKPKESKRRKRY